MNVSSRVPSVLLLVLCLVGVGFALGKADAQVPAKEVPAVRWEYKVIQANPSDARFNQLGREGWELVSVAISPDNLTACSFKRRMVGDQQ